MDEKKLTDEEIVKVLAYLRDFNGSDCNFYQQAIDFVSRLYDERACFANKVSLYQKLLDEEFEPLKETIKKQKAEIERMTEWKDKLQDTKDELEQTLIDTGFKEYCEENKRLEEQNTELQKQVYELKKNAHHWKSACEHIESETVKDTAKEILEGLEERKEQVKAFYGIAESVGVDVAIKAVKEIVKQKGVEVE